MRKFSELVERQYEIKDLLRKTNSAKLNVETCFGVKIEDGRHSTGHLDAEDLLLFENAINALHTWEERLTLESSRIENADVTLSSELKE